MKSCVGAFMVVAATVFTLSCNKQEESVTPPPLVSEFFQSHQLTMWADRQNVVMNTPINVTQKCRPLYSGKGYIRFTLLGGGRTVIIDSPVADTLGTTTNSVNIPLTFQGGADFVHNLQMRFIQPPNIDYGFESSIHVDSILINGRYYYIQSDEAKKIAPVGNSFRSFASTNEILYFKYR